MEGACFDDIRPYINEEVPAAVKQLLASGDWSPILTPLLGAEATAALLGHMASIESIERFQSLVSQPLIEAIIAKTTAGVSFEMPRCFDPVGALFISNHRDIVLDPSLINVALAQSGAPTTEIGIGSNLLRLPWVECLVKLNRSFIVRRGGTPREQLMNSAQVAAYVRRVVLENRRSVWLAQREGRAKDGDDRTSPALVRMLLDGGGKEAWEALRVHPVSLSYEWDPCDAMKVRELLLREAQGGQYEKAPGEDEQSMKLGLFGPKGRVVVHFGEPIPYVEGPGRPAANLATALDEALFRGFRIWPNQIWAARQVAPPEGWDWRDNHGALSPEEVSACEARLESVVQWVESSTSFSAREIRERWCRMVAQPLWNAEAIAHSDEKGEAALRKGQKVSWELKG
jgi:hypothetical protein